MYEHFTEKALGAVSRAHDEAIRTGHLVVGTAQLLIGLLGVHGEAARAWRLPADMAVGCLAVFVFAFAFSLGPIPYVIMSEIFPIRVHGLGMSLAASAAWGCNVIVTITFLSLLKLIGQANLFWCYCAICAIGLAFSFFTVPETKNRSLEDIEANLNDGVSTRNLGRSRKKVWA